MGNVVGIGGHIVNPMAVNVLELTVDQNGTITMKCDLPPDKAISVLQNVITNILINYINAVATQKSNLQ